MPSLNDGSVHFFESFDPQGAAPPPKLAMLRQT